MLTTSKLRRRMLRPFAFSLIELLIVIGIISVLVGLLIPAIQSLRNAAGRAHNSNNMRQILISVNTYAADHNGAWPGNGNWSSGSLYGTGSLLLLNTAGPMYGACVQDSSGNCLEDPTKAQTNWIDGGTMFQLLPYTEYAVVFHESFGPMLDGSITGWQGTAPGPPQFQYSEGTYLQFYNVGDWVWWGSSGSWPDYTFHYFQCTKSNWGLLYSPTALNPAYWTPGTPPPFGVNNGAVTSTSNFGWQAGRHPARIKAFIGVGDPSVDFPGVIAPLSYPLFGGVIAGGSLEQVDSSLTAFITENYAACSFGQPGQNVAYGSYAGGAYSDASSGNYPSNSTVNFPSQFSVGSSRVWLRGTVTPGPNDWGYVTTNHECPTVGSCPVPTSPPCDPNDDRPACNQGIKYYLSHYSFENHDLFYDEPTICDPGLAHSLIKGTLDIGFLDGSVRHLSRDADFRIVEAIRNGTAMNFDPDNF